MCRTFYLAKNATKSQPNVPLNLLKAFNIFFIFVLFAFGECWPSVAAMKEKISTSHSQNSIQILPGGLSKQISLFYSEKIFQYYVRDIL